MTRGNVGLWLAVGWAGFALLPWSAIGGVGFFGGQWWRMWPHDVRAAPAAFLLIEHGRLWLAPVGLALALPAFAFVRRIRARSTSQLLIAAGCLGLAGILAIAVAIDITGWTWPPLATLFGALPGRQPGLGYGALVTAAASLMFLCQGLALRGWVKGDAFVAGAIGASVALVGLFTLYPLLRLFARALLDRDGHWSLAALATRFVSSRWSGI